MMAGGDGTLGVVAHVAVANGSTFGCFPVGTGNHIAMVIRLDQDDPLDALQAVSEPTSFAIDFARIGGRARLSNVSFGAYAAAIGDPGYRNHRAHFLADAARRFDPRSADRPDMMHPEVIASVVAGERECPPTGALSLSLRTCPGRHTGPLRVPTGSGQCHRGRVVIRPSRPHTTSRQRRGWHRRTGRRSCRTGRSCAGDP